MKRYTLILLSSLFTFLAAISLFNLIIDPYAATDWMEIDGINARKTRAHEDGRRVTVSHQILKRPEASLIIGSSRVVDGFNETMDDWPGGLYNAGIRGSNAYELAHIAALATQKKELRCLVIGLDISEFSGGDKFKSAFLLSRFPDGSNWRSLGRMMLSPYTLTRAVQTLGDNMRGNAPKPPFQNIYEAGEQRARYTKSVKGVLESHQALTVSGERIDYLFRALDVLAAQGVQIIGFLHPVHAWYEDPSFQAGQKDATLQLRKTLLSRFQTLAEKHVPNAPCSPDEKAVLWDFSGFQAPSTTAIPAPAQTKSHEYCHEPAHYLPRLGDAILSVMQGKSDRNPQFGVKLTPQNIASSAEQIDIRRTAYMKTTEGQKLDQIIQALSPRPEPVNSQELTEIDWENLERLLK